MTTFRPPSARRACRRRLSSTVRNVLTPSSPLPGSGMLRGLRPGGEQQGRVLQPAPVVQDHGPGGRVQFRDLDAEPKVDVVRAVPVLGHHRQGVVAGFAQQVVL